MNVYETLLKRRSVRKYTDQPVTEAEITHLLKAGMAAPSARNVQPWEFIVVDDPAILAAIRSEFNNMDYNAPAAIIVCGKLSSNVAKTYWVTDCSLASGNILNAAVELGLGGIWCALYPRELRMARVRELLGLPEDVYPLNVIMLGHPAETPEARTQYDKTKVYWNQYEDRDEK